MARKTRKPKKGKNGKKRPASAKSGKKKSPRLATPSATVQLVNAGMHDFTNLATAVKAYLELLSSQSTLDPKQKYYVDRAREQVEMMVDLVRELKDKIS